MSFQKMSPEEQEAYVTREKRFIARERAALETGVAPTELPREVRPIEKVVPTGNWMGPVSPEAGVVCAEREIDVQIYDPGIDDYKHERHDVEQRCVVLPRTAQCFIENLAVLKENSCQTVKLAYACSDETVGRLTPLQAAGISGVDHSTTKECVVDMVNKDELNEPPRWKGEQTGKGRITMMVSRRAATVAPAGIPAEGYEPKAVETKTEVIGPEKNQWLGEFYYAMPKDKRQTFLEEIKK